MKNTLTIKIYHCDCSECKGKHLAATINGMGIDTETGGYEDIESLLDNVGEIIILERK